MFIAFFRLILFYISGILVAISYPADLFMALMLLLALSLLYLIAWITAFSWRNPIGLLLVFIIGYTNLLLQTADQKRPLQWVNQKGYIACIQKVYHPLSCKALITHIKDDSGWYKHRAYIQLYFSKQCDYRPKRGDALLILPTCRLPSANIRKANPLSSVPHPCMYRHTLKQIGRDFIPVDQSSKWRAMILEWCAKTIQLKDDQAMALVATLLWGAKDTLSPKLQKAYADTGTIHVLAISGLHVGMFYLLIKAIVRSIFRNIGFLIGSELLTLLWLWLYAGLCDFAPPILRATIMITMGRLAFLMGRGSNPYNGLFASAFGLLVWNPLLLFNCGFQLSYLATLGILYLQPAMHRLIRPQNYWLEKIWTATTLSTAAQMSTLPLILHYFKQFPLYFIISNWLVVPAIFVILMIGLALLVGSHLPIVGTLLAFILEKLIFATNAWVCWVAKWPMSTLAPCFLSGRSACLLYIVLVAAILFFKYKNLIYPIIISLCTIWYAAGRIQVQKQCKMICSNNAALSFTLKDGIASLSCNDPPSNQNLLRYYTGGTIAIWYHKVIFTIDKIPTDWHRWRGAKLHADYLLIDERLLPDIAIILKIFTINTLVVYTQQTDLFPYNLKKLGIRPIWLKPGAEKTFTWSKGV